MLAIVNSMALSGLDGYLVSIQVDISDGLPYFEIVGLPDASVRESKERVKTAIKNSKIHLNSKRIIINLAPANTRKEGSKFDLPIAIGILVASKVIKAKGLKEFLDKSIFIGELSLNGNVEKVNGILATVIESKKKNIKRIFLPKDNVNEAAMVEGIEVFPVENLNELINCLNRKSEIKKANFYRIDIENKVNYNMDFSEVQGQENVKRALEIVAAGGHNCCLIGSPGVGKTMLAKRLPTILPQMTFEESLETTKIYSIAGLVSKENPLILERPFRSPHYSITTTSLIGGGTIPKPGEISLAQYGVLFLDELTEFKRSTIETLRIPLEDKKIIISRLNTVVTYPANFILVASMNPCPCGYFGSKNKKCICKPAQIKKYINKISGPLLDRMDLHIEVESANYKQLNSNEKVESPSEIQKRVNVARKLQVERYKKHKIYSNSELTPELIKKYCELDSKSQNLLDKAFSNLGLSARGYNKILKVARTIADLEGKEKIELSNVAEAIQYRSLDRKYWN